jgi:hypothetical protein
MSASRLPFAFLVVVIIFGLPIPVIPSRTDGRSNAALFGPGISLTTLGTAYTQDFDALANTGTSSIAPTGWSFLESGTNANTTYSAGTGSSNVGDTYSFGAASSTERALGQLRSGSVSTIIGAVVVNNTGTSLAMLDITYTGEQWRIGNNAAARDDRMDFQYSLDATSLTTGTWIDVDGLDFVNPIKTAASAGALDGNNSANRATMHVLITGLNIPNGSIFWIRWTDIDASGSDDGLAIDDFSMIPNDVTAAGVSLSGRVATASGQGIRGVTVMLTGGALAQPQMVRTSSFGYFAFDDLEPGTTYVVTVISKKYFFAQPIRTITTVDNVSGIDFVAEPEE